MAQRFERCCLDANVDCHADCSLQRDGGDELVIVIDPFAALKEVIEGLRSRLDAVVALCDQRGESGYHLGLLRVEDVRAAATGETT